MTVTVINKPSNKGRYEGVNYFVSLKNELFR